ncbi:MAG: hypothetical protein Terrestrivirus1_307 [Terrestrivirus sp.]|uniref:Uncharacterized protein n=1 Tax=Terrestrivirus sp. TaxID=2487775 RepID=A0A3G4ZPB0_9VIRU|nr:MAG: hypothetical protein Terrestrivirus1_307 [Terrestrivirus sp.]
MYGYKWTYFPARLHTTKEIIYFLENIHNIKHVIDNNPTDLTNMIFGDIYHPGVINDSNLFINNISNIIKNINIKKLILEISSRKVYNYNNIPINHYYCSRHESLVKKYNLELVHLSHAEIDKDLDRIVELAKQIFNKDIEVHIIPHLNLKTNSTNNYIEERNNFVTSLENLCNIKNIKIHNIGKYIESIDDKPFLEEYMADSTHYSKGYDNAKRFLIGRIY